MKRSFRVATVFTGAAACAIALTPAAEAAPMAPGGTAKITPATTGGNCNPSLSTTSLHLYYTPAEHHSLAACFAGGGTFTIGKGKKFQFYCAGQYSGHLFIGGQARHFTAGVHSLHGASVSKVSISRNNNSPQFCPPFGS